MGPGPAPRRRSPQPRAAPSPDASSVLRAVLLRSLPLDTVVSTTAGLKGLRVLVVEDEALIALDLCLVLEDLGCRPVGPAASVGAALDLLRGSFPDAALLDENLGTTLVTPVAEALAHRDVPFAIVSGHHRSLSSNPLLVEALRLPKPARRARIARALAALTAA